MSVVPHTVGNRTMVAARGSHHPVRPLMARFALLLNCLVPVGGAPARLALIRR